MTARIMVVSSLQKLQDAAVTGLLEMGDKFGNSVFTSGAGTCVDFLAATQPSNYTGSPTLNDVLMTLVGRFADAIRLFLAEPN